jgi:hypothetical protein
MFLEKSSKVKLSACIGAIALLLQGCSSSDPTSEPAPTQVEEAIVESKYNPKISPAFAEPWPTNVTRQEMIETALFKSFEFMDEVKVESCPVSANVFIGESVLDEHVPLIHEISRQMNLVFCDYLREDIHIVSGGYDFLKTTLESESLPTDKFGGTCGYDISTNDDAGRACAYQGVAWVGKGLGTKRAGNLLTDETAVAGVAHETFHLVQDSLDPGPQSQIPGPDHPFYRPVWFIEGGGEYFGKLIPSYLRIQDYSVVTPTNRSGSFLSVDYLSDLEGFEIWKREAGGLENYYAGQIAHEYIVASVGLNAIMQVLVRMGEGAGFESAFESAIGLTVSDFYDKFALLHANLYEGELVK